MKLVTKHRSADKKSEAKKLRRDGFIPAVLYARGKEGETLAVQTTDFAAFLRNVKSGHLPTSIFTLVDEKGKERRAVIKDIQYNITTYDVIHLDFEELVPNEKISIKVPIELVGGADCQGVKLGGFLRQVIRHLKVMCLPKDIPSYLELDVKDLGLNQSKRLADIPLANTLRPLANMKEVAAVVVKR